MNNVTAPALQTIPRKIFLFAYLIVPLLLAVVLVDTYYLDAVLRPYLGIGALFIPIYIFIFDLPHIMASFFSFFDREYISYYKKHLFFYLPGLLIATALLLFVNYELGLVFYLVNDLWHGIRQKVGIALILGARPGTLHTAWTLVPFIVSSFAYVLAMRPNFFSTTLTPYITTIIGVGMVAIFVLMCLKIYHSAPKVRWYIFAVSALFLCSYLFISLGYAFFAILAFRFVHDVSAFAFYITHDHNRNKNGAKNWLYKIVGAIPLPYFIMVPVLAFTAAYAVRSFTDQTLQIGFSVVILIAMCHYYLESVMWKRDTPHRQNVRVSQ